jgi:hypothetical protein
MCDKHCSCAPSLYTAVCSLLRVVYSLCKLSAPFDRHFILTALTFTHISLISEHSFWSIILLFTTQCSCDWCRPNKAHLPMNDIYVYSNRDSEESVCVQILTGRVSNCSIHSPAKLSWGRDHLSFASPTWKRQGISLGWRGGGYQLGEHNPNLAAARTVCEQVVRGRSITYQAYPYPIWHITRRGSHECVLHSWTHNPLSCKKC